MRFGLRVFMLVASFLWIGLALHAIEDGADWMLVFACVCVAAFCFLGGYEQKGKP